MCVKVFPIGVINVMGVVQATHQMCMWQTTILIFNHVKCNVNRCLPNVGTTYPAIFVVNGDF